MKLTDTQLAVEIEQQIFSYLYLCAMYETQPSILGFANHLEESYTA